MDAGVGFPAVREDAHAVFVFEVSEELEDWGVGEEVRVRCCPDARVSDGGNGLRGGYSGFWSQGCFGGGVCVLLLGFAGGRGRGERDFGKMPRFSRFGVFGQSEVEKESRREPCPGEVTFADWGR